MPDPINNLLQHPAIQRAEPSYSGDIEAIQSHFGQPIPELLLSFWRTTDGVTMDGLDAHCLGPLEVRLLLEDSAWSEGLRESGFIPLLDDHQSNYMVLMIRDPFAYRVAHVPHDDDSRILYRDLMSFFADLCKLLDSADTADDFYRTTVGEYQPDGPRTTDDRDAAHAALKIEGDDQAWRYAAQLLAGTDLPEWQQLLETDHFVRRDVRARMRKMRSPAIRAMLAQDDLAVKNFVNAVSDAVKLAGHAISSRPDGILNVDGKSINLDFFFYRRNVPDATRRIIEWIEDLLAGRNPHHREGHLLRD